MLKIGIYSVYDFVELMQRIFKYGDIHYIILTPAKELLNILIYIHTYIYLNQATWPIQNTHKKKTDREDRQTYRTGG